MADARGCYIYNPAQNDGDTVTWAGGCRNGLTPGSGELSRTKKGTLYNRYTGVLIAGREEGIGSIQYTTGEKYEGDFVDSFRSGKGVQYVDNGRYEGSWVLGSCCGDGIYYEPDGTIYKGEFAKWRPAWKRYTFLPGRRQMGGKLRGRQTTRRASDQERGLRLPVCNQPETDLPEAPSDGIRVSDLQ